MLVAGQIRWNQIPRNFFPIHAHFDDALADPIRIMNDDPVRTGPEPARRRKTFPGRRDARVDPQAVQFRSDTQDVLSCAEVAPGSGTGQPGGTRVSRPGREGRLLLHHERESGPSGDADS